MTHEKNIIRALRELVPNRPLSFGEAERITELQANRLRELLGIDGPRFPEEAVYSLPRIEVESDVDMEVSGLTFWHNGRWVIRLNATEPHGRRRFSLLHELKHAVDHTTKHRLFPATMSYSSDAKAERLSDYFSGCVLMPKRHVKRLFGERKALSEMAKIFDVTPRAMAVRLSQIGLREPLPRCQRPTRRARRFPKTYFRALSTRVGVPA